MDRLVQGIFIVFGVWIGWRLITRKMRRTVVAMGFSVQHEVLESHRNDDGVLVITKSRPISVSPVPITQYDVLIRTTRMLWNNAKKQPRLMGQVILSILRRPR